MLHHKRAFSVKPCHPNTVNTCFYILLPSGTNLSCCIAAYNHHHHAVVSAHWQTWINMVTVIQSNKFKLCGHRQKKSNAEYSTNTALTWSLMELLLQCFYCFRLLGKKTWTSTSSSVHDYDFLRKRTICLNLEDSLYGSTRLAEVRGARRQKP